MSILLSIGINVMLVPVRTAGAGQRGVQLGSAIVVGVLALIGIGGGIVALCGIRRHGRRGLLWPAITGLGIWLLLAALAIPTFNAVRKKAALVRTMTLKPLTQIPGGRPAYDSELGFVFQVPPEYGDFAPETKPAGYRHAFIHQEPAPPHSVLLVKGLGGTLGRVRLKAADIPKGQPASLVEFNWRGRPVDGIRVPEKTAVGDYVTFNVQIPLRKQGVQFGFGGPAASEAKIREVVEKVLSSLDGQPEF